METTEQTAVAKNCVHAIVRGKRTKRRRLHLPPSAPSAAASSSSSSCTELPASTTLTEEEEDMANCLILLAHGRVFDANPKPEAFAEDSISGHERFTSRRFAEAATTSNGKAGFCVYECKTCNKCFPSFQALGGHRASHKKPKIGIMAAPVALEKKAMIDEVDLQISMNNFSKPIILPANGNVKTKVHECSICGAEFSSGQALGGHMRRHRPLTIPEAQEAKREQSQRLLSLDLNLPAPSDDDRGEFARPPEVFAFVEKRPLLLSASALVDCHY